MPRKRIACGSQLDLERPGCLVRSFGAFRASSLVTGRLDAGSTFPLTGKSINIASTICITRKKRGIQSSAYMHLHDHATIHGWYFLLIFIGNSQSPCIRLGDKPRCSRKRLQLNLYPAPRLSRSFSECSRKVTERAGSIHGRGWVCVWFHAAESVQTRRFTWRI